ncbi:MAG TPA: BadF/BadG/BcrA/BcrD ATPase family protein, partial [Anaerolineaceae bacterium]
MALTHTRYFLGVDVGSSKTHAMVADQNGQVCGFGQAGAGNHEGVGYSGLQAALKAASGKALAEAGLNPADIAGAGFGVSGYDWPSERVDTLNAIAAIGLNCPVETVNDAILGLVAGARAGWGVAVVAGTGCNCWGWDVHRRIGHVTGAGEHMGEAAGAYEVVDAAVARISRAWSLRGPVTRLTEAFIAQTGAKDQEDLIEGLIMERYSIDARSAQLVFQVAEDGDPVAREVIAWAGEALADLAVGVIHQLHFERLDFEVVLVGSLYNGGTLTIEPMRSAIQRVAPGASLVRLEAPPVVGGVLLGMLQTGVDPSGVRESL